MKQWKDLLVLEYIRRYNSSGSYLLLFGKRQWISCQIFYK